MNPTEVELKLLLPGADPAAIEQALASLPALAGTQPQRQWLWNRYYDTASQELRRQRSALRLRCVSLQPWTDHDPTQPPAGEWIQTFKTAGVSQGGLSRRGEWESKVASGALDQAALNATPWKDLDPKGELFEQLQPCFDTRCRRTTWLLQVEDGSRIEVALDVGEIAAAGQHLPLLELELELQAGMPEALFGLAQQIAARVAVLPCDASKAERGYALAQGVVHAPARARPVHLPAMVSPLAAAQQAMAGMLEQFTRNLAGLLHADDPELVHQARVAWRRWRSSERLFHPWLAKLPERTALRPLLDTLGRLRDLDVACTETLPAWLDAYAGGKAQRRSQAERTLARLQLAAQSQRHLTRQLLAQPGSGQGLLQLAHWLHELGQQAEPDEGLRKGQRDWARERSARLLRRLQQAIEASEAEDASEAQQHRTRLLAKRVRYGVETLHDLLPQKKADRWARQASQLQTRLGAERDLLRAIALLQEIGEDGSLTDFLRGVAAAHQQG
ncbi:MAG: hypothetical protein RLZZ555_2074 [Pseudomonadota bacterium]|jgi:inorganic triphosphatase YgiF